MVIDPSGEISRLKSLPVKVEGSHSTKLTVRVDKDRVYLSGNVGRFGRRDNLFNFDVDVTKRLANAVMDRFGLPRFDSRAKIVRIDLTTNYATGSASNARQYLWSIGRIATGRQKRHAHPDGATVEWGGKGNGGSGSRYVYSKVYIKGTELYKKQKKTEAPQSAIDYCHDQGIVRYEVELKQALYRKGLKNWNDCTTETTTRLFEEYRDRQIMAEIKTEANDISKLSKEGRMVYNSWKCGEDLVSMMSRATWYRHRRKILDALDVDIAERCKDPIPEPKVKVIYLKPITELPANYLLDEEQVVQNIAGIDVQQGKKLAAAV